MIMSAYTSIIRRQPSPALASHAVNRPSSRCDPARGTARPGPVCRSHATDAPDLHAGNRSILAVTDHMPDDSDVAGVTTCYSRPASLSRDRRNSSRDLRNIFCCTPTLKRLWPSSELTPHEIKILVTDSCLHSSSTGLEALSSFTSCIRRYDQPRPLNTH